MPHPSLPSVSAQAPRAAEPTAPADRSVAVGSHGQRSKSPVRFTHHGLNASGSCSGESGNVLAVGTYCYVAGCALQTRSARRREAARRPQREERGKGGKGSGFI